MHVYHLHRLSVHERTAGTSTHICLTRDRRSLGRRRGTRSRMHFASRRGHTMHRCRGTCIIAIIIFTHAYAQSVGLPQFLDATTPDRFCRALAPLRYTFIVTMHPPHYLLHPSILILLAYYRRAAPIQSQKVKGAIENQTGNRRFVYTKISTANHFLSRYNFHLSLRNLLRYTYTRKQIAFMLKYNNKFL